MSEPRGNLTGLRITKTKLDEGWSGAEKEREPVPGVWVLVDDVRVRRGCGRSGAG